ALIVRDGNRGSAVIRQIRGFLKSETSESVLLDVSEIIREALDFVRFELEKNQIKVSLDLPGKLPLVRADPVQLEHVILNLTIDGSDAMLSGTDGPRRWRAGAQLASNHDILFSIRDSGAGIDPQQTEPIFDPFFSTTPAGMGMGLSICRSIVEANGGRIW